MSQGSGDTWFDCSAWFGLIVRISLRIIAPCRLFENSWQETYPDPGGEGLLYLSVSPYFPCLSTAMSQSTLSVNFL